MRKAEDGKRVPITEVKELAQNNNYDFAVVFMWNSDSRMESVATWGKSQELCELAAKTGNKMKTFLGWPEELTHAKPARQKTKEKKKAEKNGE